MEQVPITRNRLREIQAGARRADQHIQRGIQNRVRTASQSSVVQSLQRVVGGIENFFEILTFSLVLIYQIVKYVSIMILVILGIIGAYYGFKYVLLFMIWIQHFFV